MARSSYRQKLEREISFLRHRYGWISDGRKSDVSVGHFSDRKKVVGILHPVVSLGIILVIDKFLKQAFLAAAIKFPSALFGMFCMFSILMILDSVVPSAAMGLMNFFEPANLFIQRWLPLFYIPSLVVLPLTVKDIPAASGIKICFILDCWNKEFCMKLS